MGLDHTEFLLDLEDYFDVSIPLESFNSPMKTVGDVQGIIILSLQREKRYFSDERNSENFILATVKIEKDFYSSLKKILPPNTNSFTDKTHITTLFPQRKAKKIWKSLEKQLSISLPSLAFVPRFPFFGDCILFLLFFPLAFVFLLILLPHVGGLLCFCFVVCFSFRFFYIDKIPPDCSAVENLKSVYMHQKTPKYRAWSKEKIWEGIIMTLRQGEYLELEEVGTITENSCLVEDLGFC